MSSDRTTYVFDTSALIHDPSIYKNESFHHSDVIIPIAVLGELDKLKKIGDEVGRNARVAIKLIDEITQLGDVSIGILLDNDILFRIDTFYSDEYPDFGPLDYGDTQILICAYNTFLKHASQDVVLVSKDICLRVKAEARGLTSLDCSDNKKEINDFYQGFQIVVSEETGIALQKATIIDPREYNLDLLPNECIAFETETSDVIAMGRNISENKVKLIKKYYPWQLASRNKEQSFAIDMIMDKNIDLVTLTGKAGCGKTLVALACALELVCNRKEYDKLVIYRPIQPMGNDIGFTPGSIQEKLEPWFQAVYDNMETLLSFKNHKEWRREMEMLQKKGMLQLEALTYIRGRSIPNAIILIDECQNLSKDEIKTVLTRSGENTKILMTGDIFQIDSPKLDASNNGLSYVIDKFKTSDLAGHINFNVGERSRLATLASDIL